MVQSNAAAYLGLRCTSDCGIARRLIARYGFALMLSLVMSSGMAVAASPPSLPLAPAVLPGIALPRPPAPAGNHVAANQAASPENSAPKIGRFQLPNGLDVVVMEVPDALVVTHMLWYRVGAADDPLGKSGLAHFVEHMMFQGTDHQKPGDFLRAMERLGGEENAFTTPDFTAYYVHIAKQFLPEVMKREADRMQYMNPPEAAFIKEREVILEERRQQVETDPGNRMREEIDAALFIHHPYRTPVIGWQAEMETLNRQDVLDFQHAHYAPNAAILVLAGGIGLPEARALAEKYYGAVPAKALPARVAWVEPKAKASIRLEYKDAQAQQPSYMESWAVPSVAEGTAKALPYFVLSSLLGESNSSRLFQQLVVGQRVATEAGTNYVGLARGPGRFVLWAVPTDPAAATEAEARLPLEKAAEAELVALAQKGVDAPELERVKNQLKASAIYAMDGVQEAASLLGQLVMLGLPENYLRQWPDDIEAVTAAQVQAAAQDLLARRRVQGWLIPEPGKGAAAAPAARNAKSAPPAPEKSVRERHP